MEDEKDEVTVEDNEEHSKNKKERKPVHRIQKKASSKKRVTFDEIKSWNIDKISRTMQCATNTVTFELEHRETLRKLHHRLETSTAYILHAKPGSKTTKVPVTLLSFDTFSGLCLTKESFYFPFLRTKSVR